MISVKNVNKFFGEKQVLKDVNIEINEGEIFGIIGHSGAGKSTILRCMNGLEPYQEGSVKVDGKEVKDLNEKEMRELRKDLGMIFQHFSLLERKTVFENVALPLECFGYSKAEKEKRVMELLDLVGLKERRNDKPRNLSGGQKQRVAIARALANNPDILLSDEATSALDPKTTNSILDLLKNIQQKFGLTVVMITHQMEVIRDICNRVAVMADGRIVETGGVHHIFSAPQSEVTKELISYLPSTEEKGVEIMKTKGKMIIKLKFLGTIAEDPIISQAVRNFNIDLSILGGSIDHLSTMKVGHLFIELSGEMGQQKEAIEWFNESGVIVEVIYNGI